eukprot:COSAG01_NODE_7632_length_3120_cov_7.847733_2_plen_93_part_00
MGSALPELRQHVPAVVHGPLICRGATSEGCASWSQSTPCPNRSLNKVIDLVLGTQRDGVDPHGQGMGPCCHRPPGPASHVSRGVALDADPYP